VLQATYKLATLCLPPLIHSPSLCFCHFKNV
jgi:hypothetical protein